MPVYGSLILGDAAFAAEVQVEKATGMGVYGVAIPMGDPADAPVAAPSAPETGDLAPPVTDPYAEGLARVEAMLGEGYSVADAKAGLAADPALWQDLARAEIRRADTAGVRKTLVELLLAAAPADESLLVTELQLAIV